MKREEKILKIKNYVRKAIKEMGANYNCIVNVGSAILDFATYFPHISKEEYTYIEKVYEYKVVIVNHGEIYAFSSHTVDSYSIPYEKLTDRDLDNLYKNLIGK